MDCWEVINMNEVEQLAVGEIKHVMEQYNNGLITITDLNELLYCQAYNIYTGIMQA